MADRNKLHIWVLIRQRITTIHVTRTPTNPQHRSWLADNKGKTQNDVEGNNSHP